MLEPMPIPETAAVIADCWIAAERKLRSLVGKKYFDADEEILTFLFTGELRQAISRRSIVASLKEAFARDVAAALRACD